MASSCIAYFVKFHMHFVRPSTFFPVLYTSRGGARVDPCSLQRVSIIFPYCGARFPTAHRYFLNFTGSFSRAFGDCTQKTERLHPYP